MLLPASLWNFVRAIVCLYPCACSLRAIVHHSTEEAWLWLTFWAICALLVVGEYVTDCIVPWVPCASLFYTEAKLVLLLVLMHPLVLKASHTFLCSAGFLLDDWLPLD
eukprot:gnl/Hemi2/18345_TR6083_c0_g1_i1.p3 gnl/Hemi2/18345_TR6083_c0_g1~~gnl/Hemi2/18345_TR6083_c0_g1_i1.p3  ORF type:complete len:108 (+),score=8.66 gnl/Hemi2/18345_TR6083_c0_g1_i1:84-407(+)